MLRCFHKLFPQIFLTPSLSPDSFWDSNYMNLDHLMVPQVFKVWGFGGFVCLFFQSYFSFLFHWLLSTCVSSRFTGPFSCHIQNLSPPSTFLHFQLLVFSARDFPLIISICPWRGPICLIIDVIFSLNSLNLFSSPHSFLEFSEYI